MIQKGEYLPGGSLWYGRAQCSQEQDACVLVTGGAAVFLESKTLYCEACMFLSDLFHFFSQLHFLSYLHPSVQSSLSSNNLRVGLRDFQ